MTTTLANQLPRINLVNGGSMQSAQILTLKSGATGPLPRLTQNRRCTHLSFVLESRASSPDLSRYRTCSYWSSTRPVSVNREFRFAWEKVIYSSIRRSLIRRFEGLSLESFTVWCPVRPYP